MDNSRDWLKLTAKQREDVISLRDRMNRHLIAETEAFYAQHPELKLTWAFVCDALIRVDEDGTIREAAQPESEAKIIDLDKITALEDWATREYPVTKLVPRKSWSENDVIES